MVSVSVYLCVGHNHESCRMAELIEMLFGGRRMGPWNRNGGPYFPLEGAV